MSPDFVSSDMEYGVNQWNYTYPKLITRDRF